MKHLRIKIIIAAFTFVVGVSAAAIWLIKFKPDTNVYSVSFCDLMRDSKLYDGKVIETVASYQQGYEASFLINSDCKGSITNTCSLDSESCNKLFNTLANSAELNQTRIIQGRYHDSAYDDFDGYVHQIEVLQVK